MDANLPYRPGLHILSSIAAAPAGLGNMDACRRFFDRIIAEKGLVKVGEAYHSFDGGGFTAVVALTESHMSIHTWPEFGQATFDVFLSNFLRDNTATVRDIYKDTLAFLGGTEISKTELQR